MTELFIDGKIAIPNQAANIKLTSENIYFTKTSSYTYDVELPLSIAENRAIFGPINRLDVAKESRRLSARLVVDNVTVLTGEAHITSVNQNAVKIQLLGEAASYNYGNKMDDTYLDQMELGDWYWETWPDGSYRHSTRGQNAVQSWQCYPPGTKVSSASTLMWRAYYKGPDYGAEEYTEAEMIEIFLRGDLGWVAYPTYNATGELRHNAIAWKETSQGSRTYTPFLRYYEGERGGRRHYEGQVPVTASFSIQPFLWKVVEVVAKATGFSLDRADNALYNDTFFRRIFLVNTSASAEINKCLPHWSVNQFWEQIENTFGVVLSIDYSAMKIKLNRRADHYKNAPIKTLSSIVEDFETTLEDETQTDISVNNVGFADFESNPEDVLSEEITSNAEYMEFDSTEALFEWAKNAGRDLTALRNVIFKCNDGREFILSTNVNGVSGIIEVNMFRPRLNNPDNDDIEVELKIVPARYSVQNADLYATWYRQPGAASSHRDIPDGTFEVTMLQVPGQESPELDNDYSDIMNIQAILEGEEEAKSKNTDKPDLMYIAIQNHIYKDSYNPTITLQSGGDITKTFYYPRALLRERRYGQLSGTLNYFDFGESLSLIPIEGQTNLANSTVKDLVSIRTIVRHCIKFISDTIPDTGSIFIIRNKRFVCEKIEATIKPDGLDRLLTGYFYEFDS